MGNYVAQRLMSAVVVLFGVSLIVFILTHLSGDPVSLMLHPNATQEDADELRRAFGLDQPLAIQYLKFAAKAVQGDFGESLRHRVPAMELVLQRMPATLELALLSMVISVVVAVPLGIISAVHRGGLVDLLTLASSVFGQSIANFWLGFMLIYFFAVQLKWLPASGRDSWQHLILPSIAVATRLLAIVMRLTRSTMLDILYEDYVRTARAKGLKEQTVLVRHALRNALIPVVTVIALQFGTLMGGTVIIETVFMWPGVGLLTVQAITNRDFPIVQAAVFVLASIIIAVNLLTDLLYGLLDPRIRVHP